MWDMFSVHPVVSPGWIVLTRSVRLERSRPLSRVTRVASAAFLDDLNELIRVGARRPDPPSFFGLTGLEGVDRLRAWRAFWDRAR